MNLLLDTHIWLWFLDDSPLLGRHTLQELKNTKNELWLSPISTWEIMLLRRKGRIILSEDAPVWLRNATSNTHEAPLTHDIALAAEQLPLHGDPADRFLAATAQILDLTLVTADTRLLGLGTIRTLANR